MPQFDINSFASQLFWLCLVFSILYIIVSKYIAPKAENILSHRDKFIEDNIKSAKENKDKAESMQKDFVSQLEEINESASKMQKEMLDKLDQEFSNQKQQISVNISGKQTKSEQYLHNMQSDFHAQEEEYILNSSMLIIEKITGKAADKNILNKLYMGQK